jgi:hypothetical protein
MPKLVTTATLAALITLAGCAGMVRTVPSIGEPRDAVLAKFGAPTGSYRLANEEVLEYATGPFGQETYMARIGPDGKLASFEQVLTGQKFATLKIGAANKEEVRRTLGRPAETSYLALPDLEVWSYRYKENGVWNSMMHAHFDRQGILRMMQNGPDRMYEERRFFRD